MSLAPKKAQQLFLLISFLIPTFFFTNYVLNQFYTYGSGLLDVGWFTYMITESINWPLQNPAAIGGSFFRTHFSLFFYPLSYLHKYILFFIPAPVYYSLFIGSMYGFISLAVYMVGVNLIDSVNRQKLYILLIISVLSSMNGVALGLIGFPHIEIAIPSLILLFFALYLVNKKMISFIVFIFLLTIREDAGFHIFALLMTTGVIALAMKRRIKEIDLTLLSLALIALIYSILVIYIQKTYFPGDNALERVYLGNPPFAHITHSFIMHRLDIFYTNRDYIYVPIVFTIILSLYTKNYILLSAFIASLPWFFLSIIAITSMAGTLSNYYAFPFIILSVWPIFAFFIFKKLNIKQNNILRNTVVSVICITGTSVFLFPGNSYNVDSKPWKNFIFTKYNTIYNTQNFIEYLEKNKIKFGNILFDEPLSALVVKDLTKKEYGYLNRFSNESKRNADTVIFFHSNNPLNRSSLRIMRNIILDNKLKNIYLVNGTNILVGTNKKIKYVGFSKYTALFTKKYNASELDSNCGIKQNEYRTAKESMDKSGYITFGPYISLSSGKYKFNINYMSPESNTTNIGTWDVVVDLPKGIKQLKNGPLIGTNGRDAHVINTFTMPKEYNEKEVEIRNFYNGTGSLTIKSLTITQGE